jgi:hypothetical protein
LFASRPRLIASPQRDDVYAGKSSGLPQYRDMIFSQFSPTDFKQKIVLLLAGFQVDRNMISNIIQSAATAMALVALAKVAEVEAWGRSVSCGPFKYYNGASCSPCGDHLQKACDSALLISVCCDDWTGFCVIVSVGDVIIASAEIVLQKHFRGFELPAV